jgi:hypothetical protein
MVNSLRPGVVKGTGFFNRSQEGFIINLLSGLIAYSYLPKKPSLNLEIIDQSMALSLSVSQNRFLKVSLLNGFSSENIFSHFEI